MRIETGVVCLVGGRRIFHFEGICVFHILSNLTRDSPPVYMYIARVQDSICVPQCGLSLVPGLCDLCAVHVACPLVGCGMLVGPEGYRER